MKNLICLLFAYLIFCSPSLSAQSDQLIFLVRHAEKVQDGSKDPLLNDAGVIRAERLAAILKDFNIEKIYSTNYQRTYLTASPLSDMIGIEIEIYNPRESAILEHIAAQSGNILVVGHSNTIPPMANDLIGDDRYDLLSEKEYDKLFIVAKVGNYYGSSTSSF